jgi:SpoVK/Ycf46/Vps4 family AAA+-type ATPase
VLRCNVPTFFIHGPELFSQFVGSSESFLRDVFSQASAAAPSVIFIDDIDSMCPPRSEASEVEARMVGTLLTLMDGIRTSEAVVVVATTSKLGSIDPALCRAGRFDRSECWEEN